MAKYILIEFDDDKEADAFAGTFIRDTESASIHVVGVYKKPTKFCECENPGNKQVQGQKYGWWVHAVCGKPVREHHHVFKDLIHPEVHVRDRRVTLSIREPRVP